MSGPPSGDISAKINSSKSGIIIYELPNIKVAYGKPTAASGKNSYKALLKAKELIEIDKNYALVTAPISKDALKKAGLKYPGHTEMIAEWFNSKNFCMMFLSDKLKCGLLTIHEPIKSVPKLISKSRVVLRWRAYSIRRLKTE